jgi:RHS repeat-associated protein
LDDSGLYYYEARYYDPEIGRFISRDPLQGETDSPQTLNRYVYCLNNPLKYIDPAGTDPQETVQNIFNNLLNIDSEEYAEVQALIDDENYLEALKKLLELMGYKITSIDTTNNSLEVTVETGLLVTIQVNNNLRNFGNFNTVTQTAFINFKKTGKAEDIAATIAHEISHALLSSEFPALDTQAQEPLIYAIESLYVNILLQGGIGYSEEYVDHTQRMRHYYDPNRVYRIPLGETLRKWMNVQGWKTCRI